MPIVMINHYFKCTEENSSKHNIFKTTFQLISDGENKKISGKFFFPQSTQIIFLQYILLMKAEIKSKNYFLCITLL